MRFAEWGRTRMGDADMASNDAEIGDGQVRQFDHWDQSLALDPHPAYQALLGGCPVAYQETHNGYFAITRHADVKKVARDADTFSSKGVMIPDYYDPVSHMNPVEEDPPEHTLYRGLLDHAFTKEAVDTIEPTVRRFTTELIDQFIAEGECDLIRNLAEPLPAWTISNIFGIAREDWEEVQEAVTRNARYAIAGNWELQGGGTTHEIARRLFHERRDNPGDGLIGELLRADLGDRPLDEAEFLNIFDTVLGAGQDTTVALLGLSLRYLARHPDVRHRLIADPGLIPTAVEEFLRWETPVHNVGRTCTRDTVLADTTIPAGSKVMLLLGAANLDPEEFRDANQFVVDRKPNRHLTFGYGRHVCVGQYLTRMETRVVLEEVLRRIPDYEVAPDDDIVSYVQTGLIRALWSMPSTFTPGARELGAEQ
jgi:cytochrome P450